MPTMVFRKFLGLQARVFLGFGGRKSEPQALSSSTLEQAARRRREPNESSGLWSIGPGGFGFEDASGFGVRGIAVEPYGKCMEYAV